MEESPKLILVQKKMRWKEALDYCRNQSTDLASLLSHDEMLLAINVSQAAQTPYVWTGLLFVVRTWIWVDGNALEYQAWPAGGTPKCPDKNHHCGTLGKNDNIWKPGDCEEKRNFLCLRQWKG
ncbi:dromaiocalcin-1 [Brachyhypopomus gauderio]|uniref:dromaiocalcin-1 n=1 Tax=Brachyhypopomus gauderio TaxID=698409 RepID=UPI0040412F1B